MCDFVKALQVSEVPPGQSRIWRVGKREIGLFNISGEIYAIDNVCPHRGGPLAEGILEGSVISCPWHAWTFDIQDGRCTFHEGTRVETFPVRVKDGMIQVGLPPGEEMKPQV